MGSPIKLLLAFTMVALSHAPTYVFAAPKPHGTRTAIPTTSPTAIPTPSPTPSPTPPYDPPTNKCCFCVYPSINERDHDAFKQKCNTCLGSVFEGCTATASFAQEDFTEEAIKPYNCQGTINQMNLQHGPDGSYVTSQVKVCQSAYPGCSLRFDDFSCLTFQNLEESRTFISQVQDNLQRPVSVQLCGSRSVNLVRGCDAMRQTIKYNISPSEIREELGPCPAPGTLCSVTEGIPSQRSYKCSDSGTIWNQECCLFSLQNGPNPQDVFRRGVWGPLGGGCLFSGCTEDTCPTATRCDGNRINIQMCVNVEGSTGKASTCAQATRDCAAEGLECLDGGTVACAARPTPTRTPLATGTRIH
jgi:hypothetical protein